MLSPSIEQVLYLLLVWEIKFSGAPREDATRRWRSQLWWKMGYRSLFERTDTHIGTNSLATLLWSLCFSKSLMEKNRFIVEECQNFVAFLLIRLLGRKTVLFLMDKSSHLFDVPGKKNLCSITEWNWMSVKLGCPIRETVTFMTTKSLEDSIEVAQIVYMAVVTRKSQSFFIFVQISSSKFSDKVSIQKFYINMRTNV